MFVLAAGGDPHRDVGLDSIAAERLADELDTPERRAQLAAALDELPADDLPAVTAAVRLAPRRSRARLALVRALVAGRRARRRVAVSRYRDYSGRQSVAISRPEPRRRLKLPRKLPGTRQLQPYSRVDAPYFRSPGFYVRVGGLAIVVAAGLSLLLLRAWSIQVLHGKQYAQAVHQQTFRTVHLLGARGAIVDDRRRLIAGTTGHVVIDADAASLGSRNAHGVWSPSPAGLRALRRLARVTGRRWGILAARIRSDVLQSALRARRRRRPPDRRPGGVPTGTARPVPRLQSGGRGVTELSAGRLRQRVPRPARPDQHEGAASPAPTPTRSPARSWARAASRPRTTTSSTGASSQAKIPVDSLGRIAGALRVPPQKQPPTLQLSIDAAPPEGRAERAPLRDGAVAPQRPLADRGVRGGHRSLDGRDQGDRQLPDFRPEARGREAELLRAALQGDARDAPPEPGDRRRLSDRLDLQADHRRGRAERQESLRRARRSPAPVPSPSATRSSTTSIRESTRR